MPDWLELEGPTPTGRGLLWQFSVRTDRPGFFATSLAFECDAGVGTCQISVTVRDETPTLGDLVLCDSPFDANASYASLQTLVRTLDALPLRVHCVGSLADLGALRPLTLVLHQGGLLRTAPDDVATVERLAAGGTTVVTANSFVPPHPPPTRPRRRRTCASATASSSRPPAR